MTKSSQQLARLGPLLPRLVIGIQRHRGAIPLELLPAGRLGARHVSALVTLGSAGPLTVGELAERIDLTLPHASLVAGELDRAGLVERRPDERDRRRTVVSVKPAHAAKIQRMHERVGEPLVAFLDTLDPEEAEAFVSNLIRMVEHLEAAAGPDAPCHGP